MLLFLEYLNVFCVCKEEFSANFLADDLCPDVVFLGQTQSNLLNDEENFLLSFH